MKKRVRLTTKQKVNIIEAYTHDLIPMRQLAKKYGISRQGIYKILKQADVLISKDPIPISCDVCGKQILRHRFRVRKQLHHFCSNECYYAFLQAGNGFPYIDNRQGQRRARLIVSQYFQLQEDHIVHHENRNCLDNRPANLRVFANQGDHLRYHRGFDIKPIWDGRTVS